MAIRPEEYHPKWTLIVRLVLRRANGHCEKCGVPTHTLIVRVKVPGQRLKGYRLATADEVERLAELVEVRHLLTGKKWGRRKALKYLKMTYTHLEVAHLDRDRSNNRFTNLEAKCQSCHLQHDRPVHLRNRKYGRYHDREYQTRLFSSNGSVNATSDQDTQ